MGSIIVLLGGERLFIFIGYSFSDQHINEIAFNTLRQNNRLFILVFFYQDSEVDELYKVSSPFLNLTVFGPTKAIINGTLGEWEYKEDDLNQNDKSESYWDEKNKRLKLGDFNHFINFLITNSGKKEIIEEIASGQ